jgi:Spy/CpxP family protein refolding chaperone
MEGFLPHVAGDNHFSVNKPPFKGPIIYADRGTCWMQTGNIKQGEGRRLFWWLGRHHLLGRNLRMNSKRNYLSILTLFLVMPTLAAGAPAGQYQGGGFGRGQGEGGRRGPMSADEQLKRMTKDFNLTAEQQSKIKPILMDEQKRMEDLRTDSSGDRQAMRDKMMQIRQDTNDQVRALLDDKQKGKFDKLEQERQARMQNRRGGGPGGDNSGGNPPPPQN